MKIDFLGVCVFLSSFMLVEYIFFMFVVVDVNGFFVIIIIEICEDFGDWIVVIGDDIFIFWWGLKDVGLLDEVI